MFFCNKLVTTIQLLTKKNILHWLLIFLTLNLIKSPLNEHFTKKSQIILSEFPFIELYVLQ